MTYSIGVNQLRQLHQSYGNRWIQRQMKDEQNSHKQLQTALFLYQHNDPASAFQWMEKSALQENAEAQFNLALFHLQGVGTVPSSNEARKWLSKARKLGSVDARRAEQSLAVYGISALRNWGLKQTSAIKVDNDQLERVAAQEGNCDAKFYYGLGLTMKALAAGIKGQPSQFLEAAGDQGHVDSLFVMGWWQHFVLKDVKAALDLYKRAGAIEELPYIQYNLGLAYFDMGKPSYYSGIMSSCANFHDYGPAKLHLGLQLVEGTTIEQNIQAGMLLVYSAAGQDLPDAAMTLAQMHKSGKYIKCSMQNAIYWFEKAARLGRHDALYSLSIIHDPSTDQGFALLAQAAKAGVVLAQNDYGTMLAKKGDFAAAERWFRMAAAKGDKTAEKNIKLLKKSLDDRQLPHAPVAGLAVA